MAGRKKAQPIGKRLMNLRKNKKLTLKNLANETGLATRYISQVEKGEVIPPVAVLLQLSRALEIDSSILLKEEKARSQKKSTDDYQRRTEDYTYETLTPEARHKHLRAFKVFIDPQKEHKKIGYQHEGEEFVYVLSGSVEITVGDHVNKLKKGNSLHFNSGIPHKLRNLGKKRTELIVVLYTP